MKHNKLVMGLGLLLLAAALFMALGNLRDEYRAGRDAQEITRELESAQSAAEQQPAELEQEDDMTVIRLDSETYIGMIRIPDADLHLPVYSEWNYDRLRKAPCRYSGSLEGRDLILMGHDYQQHFGPIKELSAGAEVILETVDGAAHTYRVEQIETLEAGDLAAMESGDWDLTLFTCTRDGQARQTLRCRMTE